MTTLRMLALDAALLGAVAAVGITTRVVGAALSLAQRVTR